MECFKKLIKTFDTVNQKILEKMFTYGIIDSGGIVIGLFFKINKTFDTVNQKILETNVYLWYSW